MKLLFCLTLCFFTLISTHAQKIEPIDELGGLEFKRDGRYLEKQELDSILSSNEMSAPYLKKSKTHNTLAAIFGVAGGGLMIYSLSTYFFTDNFQWELGAAGAGLAIIAIPLSGSGSKNLKKAVEVYNEYMNLSVYRKPRPVVYLNAAPNRIGLSLRF